MEKEQQMEQKLSAWLDGELDAREAREVESWLASDPRAKARLEAMRSVSFAVRHGVDAAETRIDFAGFASQVMASTAETEGEKAPGRCADGLPRDSSFWAGVRERLTSLSGGKRALLAAAAGLLVAISAGSYHLLSSDEVEVVPTGPLVVRGGATVIEDLRFEEASAVVSFRTDADVTVIWVTEES